MFLYDGDFKLSQLIFVNSAHYAATLCRNICYFVACRASSVYTERLKPKLTLAEQTVDDGQTQFPLKSWTTWARSGRNLHKQTPPMALLKL